MAKGWSEMVLITTLPAFVFAHFLLWPPCKENEESILEAGFLIYSEINFKLGETQNTLDIRLFLRDCRIRILKPYTIQNHLIPKGIYLVTDNFSITDVEQFVNNCSRFEIIEFYDYNDDSVFEALLGYGTIPNLPEGCDNYTKNTYFTEGIRNLNLSHNQIRLMSDPGMFICFKNLQTLNLDSNLIDDIHEDIFKTTILITNLTLSHNKIKIFPPKLFQNLNKLEEVDLSYNSIEYVPAEAFRGTVLEKLNLSYNKLKYLPDNFFLDIEGVGDSLKVFYFECNPWYCGCLNNVLLELKELGVHYHLDRFNGVNPVCFLENTRNFKCNRGYKDESSQCSMFEEKLSEA